MSKATTKTPRCLTTLEWIVLCVTALALGWLAFCAFAIWMLSRV